MAKQTKNERMDEDALCEKALEMLNRIDYGGLSLQSKVDLLTEVLRPQHLKVTREWTLRWALNFADTKKTVGKKTLMREMLKELDIEVVK